MLTTTASSAAAVVARQLTTRRAIIAPSFVSQAIRTYATPAGPPPKGFRIPTPKTWDQEEEHALDKNGRYFLLTEMFRGMYVAMEQFFRPP